MEIDGDPDMIDDEQEELPQNTYNGGRGNGFHGDYLT